MMITTPSKNKLKHVPFAKALAKRLGVPFIHRGNKSIEKLLFIASRRGYAGVVIAISSPPKALVLMGYPLHTSLWLEGSIEEIAKELSNLLNATNPKDSDEDI